MGFLCLSCLKRNGLIVINPLLKTIQYHRLTILFLFKKKKDKKKEKRGYMYPSFF